MTSESIPGRFAQAVARFSSRIAVRATAGQWTYAELDRRSDFVAAEILERAGESSEPVAMMMAHDAPLIAAILGALKAGKMYVALDPSHPAEQLTAMLASSGAKLLLTDQANLALANTSASGRLQIHAVAEDLPENLARVNLPEIAGDADAWLMFTSGSTSAPKGVWQNHLGLVQEAEVYAELIGLKPDDRVALLASCGLAASGATLFATLLNGATLCPFHVRSQGVERLADWLPRERITVFHSVPTVFRHLARAANGTSSFATVRLIRLGGEPVLRGDVEIFRKLCPDDCRFVQSLSSTETGILSTFSMDKQTVLQRPLVPVGQAVRGMDIFLVNETNQPLKKGGEGKIAVRSARLRQGYWRQPEQTAEKFLPDERNPGFRIFISNDLGKFLPDGSLEHLGRADQLVKIRGQRVDLSELPEQMIPSDFVVLEKLPLTAAGKIDRRSLPPPLPPQTRVGLNRRERSRDVADIRLRQIWESVLNISPISRRDDFFELGGTSLQSVEVLLHIEELFGVLLPPSTLVEHSTIEKLSALLADQAFIPSPSPLVTLRDGTGGRPLFLIHSGAGDVASYGLLTRRLAGRAIYGLQSIGLQGEGWPLMSVPAMARRYLPEILAKDPSGPYLLAGTCMGGMVALELAQMLVRQGKKVGLLALLDSALPQSNPEHHPWLKQTYISVRTPMHDAWRRLRWSIVRALGLGRNRRLLPAYRRFVSSCNGRANRAYRPVFYPGELTLFITNDTKFPHEDPRLLLRSLSETTRIISIPGDRAGLFKKPAVDELALQLQRVMEKVEGKTGI